VLGCCQAAGAIEPLISQFAAYYVMVLAEAGAMVRGIIIRRLIESRFFTVLSVSPLVLLPDWQYWLLALLLLAGGVGAYVMIVALAGGQFPRLSLFLGSAIVVGIAIEGGSAILLHRALSRADAQQRQLFDGLIAYNIETMKGQVLNYAPHPYLGFALNPQARYGGIRQFDADFLIRRSEPIRNRRDVFWRILILGGSTTFGEGVPREEDTWVHLLEADLRAGLGHGIDVINGGVAGYNIVENILHYVLLLQKLDPDVVILVVGVNDVHPRLIGHLKPDYSNERMVWDGATVRDMYPNPWLTWSQFYRLLFWRRIASNKVANILRVVQRPYPPVEEWPAQLQRNGPMEYERFLRTFVRLLQSEGRKVVIVPQYWRPQHPDKSTFDNETADEYYGIGVRQHNEINEEVARQMAVPFVEKATDESIFTANLFWDTLHFNEVGSRAMAKLMADWICARPNLIRGQPCKDAEP
jgi:lysophospholipase L1-like esterase